jgi:hypothetical protein
MGVVVVEAVTILNVIAGFVFVKTDATEVVKHHARSRSRDNVAV